MKRYAKIFSLFLLLVFPLAILMTVTKMPWWVSSIMGMLLMTTLQLFIKD